MFSRLVAGLAVALCCLTGCTSDAVNTTPAPAPEQERERQTQPSPSHEQAPSECPPSIRFEGVVYDSLGYTDETRADVGEAIESECRDVTGEGTVFTAQSPVVRVRAVPGYTTADALAVAVSDSLYGVYVANTVPEQKRKAMVQELAK